jgi:hypothetical protein
MLLFLTAFRKAHPNYFKAPLFITGESYGGGALLMPGPPSCKLMIHGLWEICHCKTQFDFPELQLLFYVQDTMCQLSQPQSTSTTRCCFCPSPLHCKFSSNPSHALLLSWGMWLMTGDCGPLRATRHGDWEWADKPCHSIRQLCRLQLCKWPDQQGAAEHHQRCKPLCSFALISYAGLPLSATCTALPIKVLTMILETFVLLCRSTPYAPGG